MDKWEYLIFKSWINGKTPYSVTLCKLKFSISIKYFFDTYRLPVTAVMWRHSIDTYRLTAVMWRHSVDTYRLTAVMWRHSVDTYRLTAVMWRHYRQ